MEGWSEGERRDEKEGWIQRRKEGKPTKQEGGKWRKLMVRAWTAGKDEEARKTKLTVERCVGGAGGKIMGDGEVRREGVERRRWTEKAEKRPTILPTVPQRPQTSLWIQQHGG